MMERGWGIYNKRFGLYCGWSQTRKDAINRHCSDLGKEWIQCRKDGDTAVKLEIDYDAE